MSLVLKKSVAKEQYCWECERERQRDAMVLTGCCEAWICKTCFRNKIVHVCAGPPKEDNNG